jgi:SPX domain protein involved in polyphosphate accumulation
MEGEMDRGEKSKEKDPIMMDQEEIQEILQKAGTTRSGRPYQYKLNRKKRAVAEREGLESDEEEVEDLCVVEHIEEILCTTYERNTRGVRI